MRTVVEPGCLADDLNASRRQACVIAPTAGDLVVSAARYIDVDTGCMIVGAQPHIEPKLWDEYLAGAEDQYERHGIGHVLNVDAIRSGLDGTAMFFVAVDRSGHVVGGLRAKGPYVNVEESHALVEWAKRPGWSAVRQLISDRLSFGVIEMKSGWVTEGPALRKVLTKTLARSIVHATILLDSRFAMATSAAHVIERWASSGGVIASAIPATPYPDARYETKMMWWDRTTIGNHAEPEQWRKILLESSVLAAQLERVG